MGWKSALDSLASAERKRQREEQKRRRELLRQEQQQQKLAEQEMAALEVELFQNELEQLTTVHKYCTPQLDWDSILNAPGPLHPVRENSYEQEATKALESYAPSAVERLTGRGKKRQEELSKAVTHAAARDETEYRDALDQFDRDKREWNAQKKLADRIVSGDVTAYGQALQLFGTLDELKDLGVTIELEKATPDYALVEVRLPDEQIVPRETKTQLKSGKLSVKEMPKSHFYGLYQDFACSVVMRVACEFLALLPIDAVYVTARTALLNTATGYFESTPIISAMIVRPTLERLNLDLIDPSDALANFKHVMNFKKTSGFNPVNELSPD